MNQPSGPAWSLPERHLVTELAVGIARRLYAILTAQGAPEPGYLHHYYTTHFENGCGVLWRLGVAVAAYDSEPERKGLAYGTITNEKVWPPYFKPFEAQEIRTALAGKAPASAPPLQEVIDAYISLACDYGPTGSALPAKREPFSPQAQYNREVEALIRFGFAERCGSQARWTNKIAPAMRYACVWEDDGRNSSDVAAQATAAECAALLAQTPDLTKRVLAQEAPRLSEMDFVLLLRDEFDGLYLKKNPDGSRRPEPAPALVIRAIYRALRQKK
jgi:hypothetical protein